MTLEKDKDAASPGNKEAASRWNITPTGQISQTWHGDPLPPSLQTQIWLTYDPNGLTIRWNAPHWSQNLPTEAPGPLWGLWNYEVVEFFFLGDEEQYIEVEIAPTGHYLCLQLKGKRIPVNKMLPLSPAIERKAEGRWGGSVTLPRTFCPTPIRAWNAYSIHGVGKNRVFSAMNSGNGTPDFHQLSSFVPFPVNTGS